MSGWIKLHRSLLDWEWYDDINTKVLFLHLMLKANHKDKKYKGTLVKRGTMLTGLQLLSDETGLSIQNIRTSLTRLKSTNEITSVSSSQGTVIQIVNYDLYQEVTNELTDSQQTTNKQVTTNKNDKKEKNVNLTKDESNFIQWFNNQLFIHTKKLGKFKTMSDTDRKNLKKLRSAYDEGRDWENAFKNMVNNEWVKDNNYATISHFLRMDNFNKYVNS